MNPPRRSPSTSAPRRTATRRPTRPGGGSGALRWLAAGEAVLDHAEVVVVGGGATGMGLLWDLTLRGFDTVLVEQAGLASGTSGAFHGLLHSGARYAGTDTRTAAECLTENRILRAVARAFLDDVGGVFVRLEEDDPAWEKRWLEGCREAGLRPDRLSAKDLLAREPRLSTRAVSAYRVPDAAIDGFGLLWSLLWSAVEGGARAYFQARVTGFLTDEAGVRGVQVVGVGGRGASLAKAGPGARPRGRVEPGEITASVVVNATGPWAPVTAALAGEGVAASVPVEPDKGVMVVFNERLVSAVVNRLRPPADGDLFVPHGPATILGTTSARVARAGGETAPTAREVQLLLAEGRVLVPGLDWAPPLRAYAGLRPLFGPAEAAGEGSGAAGRGKGRGFLLVDHGETDGLPGLVTVTGGKFTTFRAMAAAAGDLVARSLGKKVACRTAEVGIPRLRQLPSRAAPPPESRVAGLGGVLACECELVDQSYLESLLDAGLNLSDLRRLARVGMGGCQGVFCRQRLAGALWQVGWPGNRGRPRADQEAIGAEISSFQQGRLAGVKPVEWGSQARLGAVAQALDRLTLGEPGPAPPSAAGQPGPGKGASTP